MGRFLAKCSLLVFEQIKIRWLSCSGQILARYADERAREMGLTGRTHQADAFTPLIPIPAGKGGILCVDKTRPQFLNSLPNDFDKHSLPAITIKLAIEDLFPRAEIEFPLGDCNNDFTAHDLPL